MDLKELVFLKLGGSLITDKDSPRTARPDILAGLAEEIAAARRAHPDLLLVLGHGSGSFGHIPARKHGTRQGVRDAQEWLGFAEVWREARALNEIVVGALTAVGLPVIAFPPSAGVTSRQGQLQRWDLAPLRAALNAGLVPLVNGDTIFDEQRGGTILSTEDLFIFLAHHLRPTRILLAGREAGVWADYPACTRLIPEITPANFDSLAALIRGSASVDVTGGMLEKVRTMLELASSLPGFAASIFSGLEPGQVRGAMMGAYPGTTIHRS